MSIRHAISEWLDAFDVRDTVVAASEGLVFVALALAFGFVAQWIARGIVRLYVRRWIERSTTSWDNALYDRHVFSRMSRVIPPLFVYAASQAALQEHPSMLVVVQRLALIVMTIVVAGAILAAIGAIDDHYHSIPNVGVPIKSYMQLATLVTTLASTILVVAIVLGKSPWFFVSGLGAMTAVLLLIFRDAILGLVASVQLAANDIVRLGDWIEVPNQSANGEVVDISLTTVKVRNWDKTISMVPAYSLVSEPFLNWRGMTDSGGRRIRRSLPIDMSSIKRCDNEMLNKLRCILVLQEALDKRIEEVEQANREAGVESGHPINGRAITNLGAFRLYIECYLRRESRVRADRDGFTFLVRQLELSANGLPIEIYVFTNTTAWDVYEEIQSDIFDHLLSVMGEFDLDLMQVPTGTDVRTLHAALARV